MSRVFPRLLLLATALLLLACVPPSLSPLSSSLLLPVSASHFAYGTISWEHTPQSKYPNRYTLTFESAWRRSWGWYVPTRSTWWNYYVQPNTGDVVMEALGTLTVEQTKEAGPCCHIANKKDQCYKTYSSYPGSGCGIWSTSISQDAGYKVKVTYPDDWMTGYSLGLYFDPPTYVAHNQRLMIVFSVCCRVGGLAYSSDSQVRVQSDVIPGHKYSPRSTSFARQYVVVNQPAIWTVPSVHPDEWDMTYRFATPTEAEVDQTSPKGDQGLMSIDSRSGRITWTPKQISLVPVQFVMEAVNPANPGLGRSLTFLDTIFQVVASCAVPEVTCFHQPVFEPVIPAEVMFYQGSAGTMMVTARNDDNNALEILTSPLPDGASISWVSTTQGKNSANNPCKWTTYQIKWTPSLQSVPSTVCFTARDATTQLSSAGSNCVNFVFAKTSILYLSVTLRDMHRSTAYPTYLTDFARTESQVDNGVNYVKSVLGPDSLPVWQGGASSVTAANFAHWFRTDTTSAANARRNLPQTYDIVLNNATTGRPNLFRWESGTSWWPLDNILFGNEGQANNRYFTMEAHTYITYTGGETLLFQSSDDLFVFIDKRLVQGWKLGGVVAGQFRSFSVNLDTHLNPATDKQKTFPVDFFYAHRSATGPARLTLSLLSATLCNSLDSGLTVIAPADYRKVTYVGPATAIVNSNPAWAGVALLGPKAGASNTGAAWWTVGSPKVPPQAQPFKVSHGFEATFSFQFGGATEGFAFVLQLDNAAAQGGSGPQLGYGGLAGIKNSLAIEFDGVQNTQLGDPRWNHVSIHSRFTQANDASEGARITGSTYSPESEPLTFSNGTVHNVKIQYIPAVDTGDAGPKYGWVRVFLGINDPITGHTLPYHAIPVTSAQVDGVVLDQMWSGAAYAGFTASTSDTNVNTVDITNFQLVVVPPSASKSYGKVLPVVMTAGQTGSMDVQLKDVCGNVITTGNDCPQLTVSLTHPSSPASTQEFKCCGAPGAGLCGTAGTIRDNSDGSYSIFYAPTYANAPSSPYRIAISYTNPTPGSAPEPIEGSPFSLTVEPGPTSPLLSTVAVSFTPAGPVRAGVSVGTVTVSAKDEYGNAQTSQVDPFLLAFSPNIVTAGGGTLSTLTKSGASTYTSTFTSPVANIYQVYVRLYSQELPGVPLSVEFLAGGASALTTSIGGSGLASAVAGVQGTFTATLRDSAGNTINSDKGDVLTGTLVKTSTAPAWYAQGLQEGLPTPETRTISCGFRTGEKVSTCTYTVNVAYTYTLNLLVNGVPLLSLLNTPLVLTVSTSPSAPADAAKSFGQPSWTAPVGGAAGTAQTILLQARDQFGNNHPASFTAAQMGLVLNPPSTVSAVSFMPLGSGLHSISFTPTKTGAATVAVTLNLGGGGGGAVAIQGSPYSLQVTPGRASTLSVLSMSSTSVTASEGKAHSFTIAGKDAYGNDVTAGGAGDFIITLTDQLTSNVVDQVASITPPSPSSTLYAVAWGTTEAGTYTLKVQTFGSDGQSISPISGGEVTVTVLPAETSTEACAVSGSGLTGGVTTAGGGETLEVEIVARDAFLNVQRPGVTDSFRVRVVSGTGGVTVLDVPATRDGTTSHYVASYQVPDVPLTPGGHSYTVHVQRQVDSGGSWVDLPSSPYTASRIENESNLYVVLPASASVGRIGVLNSFTLTETNSVGAPRPDGLFLTVDISSVATGAGGQTQRVSNVRVTPGSSGQFTVEYTPTFTLPQGNGNFLIRVSRGTTQAMAGSVPEVVAGPFPLLLSPGAVYGPQCTVTGLPATGAADAEHSVTVVLRDLYSNVINAPLAAGTVVKGTFTHVLGLVAPVAVEATASGSNPVSYTLKASLPTAGVYSVSVSYLDQSLGSAGLVKQVTVVPAAPSASKSLVQPSAGEGLAANRVLFPAYVAGSTTSFTLILRDAFGNRIDPSQLVGGATVGQYVQFKLDPSGSLGANTEYFGTPVWQGSAGVYDVPFRAFKASPVSGLADPALLALVSPTAGGTGSPLPAAATPLVHIVPADLSMDDSTLTLPSGPIVAGNAISLSLLAVDRFGNAWTSLPAGQGVLGVVVTDPRGEEPRDLFQVPIRPLVNPSASVPGLFLISLPSTALAGVYSFVLSANLLPFPDELIQLTVVPGPVHARGTVVPLFLEPVLAGEETRIELGLHDAFGNELGGEDLTLEQLQAMIDVEFPVDQGENGCGAADAGHTHTHHAHHAWHDVGIISASPPTLAFTGTVIGSYNVNITIAGTPLDCSTLSRLSLKVTAGAGVAAKSRVEGLPAVGRMTAGSTLDVFITLLDKFGNRVSGGGSNVQVGRPFRDEPPYYRPEVSDDSSTWLRNTSVIVDHANGAYSTAIQLTDMGVRQLVVTLDGWLIPTYATGGNETIAPLVEVVANRPYAPLIHSILPAVGARFAAKPFELSLAVADAFGNEITEITPQVNYTFSIDASTVKPGDYAFRGKLEFVPATVEEEGGVQAAGAGRYRWTGTSAFPGEVRLVVRLQQGWNEDCIALRGMDAPIRCGGISDGSKLVCVAHSDLCPDAKAGVMLLSVFVNATTCAAQTASESPVRPYRCPDESCVTNYALCPDLSAPEALCPPATPVRCGSDGSCVSSAEQCPCDNLGASSPLERCPSGACVKKSPSGGVNPLCHAVPACPASSVRCSTGECRASASLCPSPRVCTPGYVACNDGNSCARDVAECSLLTDPSTPATECPKGSFRCSNGRCTTALSDCPTLTTCLSGQVHCLSDGSCQSSVMKCPDQYKCYDPTPFKCPDGSCRTSAEGCPSTVTCPSGWFMCENGQCSATACLPSNSCPLTQVRCPSGACVANLMLCPSQSTCPLASMPVLCADGTCAAGVDYCVNPRVCPSGSTVCADGSCVTGQATCPSTTACPTTAPVLCPDRITCTSNASTCAVQQQCPVSTPMRCPDGSCRGALVDCPSRSSCPTEQPVRCADGSCVYSTQQCAVVPACPAHAAMRCPGGECVSALSLCPTHVTCPQGSSRCADGSCRQSCAGVMPTTCVGSYSCPLASVGSMCVSTPDQCPLSFICPAATPVRCLDSSCAATIGACPPLPKASPIPGTAACPDGSWVTDPSKCSTPVSCPASMPYKCADETCRAAPADCLVPTACTDPSKPYKCPNGACAASPYADACTVSSFIKCADPLLPVKCPVDTTCAANIESCPSSKPDATVVASGCRKGWAQCRDGSCHVSLESCPNVQCPLNLPFLCANGVCATAASACPDPLTGCYPPLLGCPTTGECVVDPDDESQCPLADSDCFLACGDGLCVKQGDIPQFNAICSSHQCSLRCADRTCGLMNARGATNINASTPGNLCTQKGTSDPTSSPLLNACPASHPYRCDTGLCTTSSLNCTELPKSGSCPPERPVECANAACVVEASQCPPLYPCATTPVLEMRCGDGSCRVAQPGDVSECKSWGIANTCPLVSRANPALGRRFRCANGLCAAGPDASSCINLATGCPDGFETKCPNGACIAGKRMSNDPVPVDRCLSPELTPTLANGCPATPPGLIKCAAGGQCVNETSLCPNAVGCLPATPFRCSTPPKDSGNCVADPNQCTAPAVGCYRCADGSCALGNDPTKCMALNGCPVLRPHRCVDGSCAEYPASALLRGATLNQVCKPTVTCEDGAVMCYDGSCAATFALCPPKTACLAPNLLCADRTCVNDAAKCGAVGVLGGSSSTLKGSVALTACPATASVLCDNGACVKAIAQCPVTCSPGSGTGSGLLGTIWQQNGKQASQQQGSPFVNPNSGGGGSATLATSNCRCTNASLPVECFDGMCVESNDACVRRSAQLRGQETADMLVSGSCGSKSVECMGGVCTPDPDGTQSGVDFCPVIPACGVLHTRCPDGTCLSVLSGLECPPPKPCGTFVAQGFKPVQMRLCQDGQCRYKCPKYDGCPHTTAPFQCPNRECARSLADCASAARGHPFNFPDVRPTLAEPLQPTHGVMGPTRRLLHALGTVHLFTWLGMSSHSHPDAPATVSALAVGEDDVDPAPIDPPITPSSGNAWTPCYSNCASQVKPTAFGATISMVSPSKLIVGVDGQGASVIALSVPAGALSLANASAWTSLGLTQPSRVGIGWGPVSDGIVWAAEHRIPSSRTNVSASGFLTHAQSVLSPMVEVIVDSDEVRVPFGQNLTLTALIDRAPFESEGSTLTFADMCLAKLYQLPGVGYAAWRCIYCDPTHTPSGSGSGSTSGFSRDDLVRCPITNVSLSGDSWQVSGSLGEPGIYAFVLAPVAEPVPPSTMGWIEENGLWVFLGVVGGVVFIFFVIYFAQRLHRYRGKYHAERDAVAAKREEVETMEQFGGAAGLKDEEVDMMSNPMVVQMKDMQARLDKTQMALREQEAQQKAEATLVRQEHIEELQTDRDALAAELEQLKKEMAARRMSIMGGPTESTVTAPKRGHARRTTSDGEFLSVGALGLAVDDEGVTAAATRTAFQAQRPKKKKEAEE